MRSKTFYLAMLRDVYVAFHREGWEEGKTVNEMMEEVAGELDMEGVLPVFETIEEVE